MRDQPVRILIADDVAEWRSQIRSMLQASPEWQVISEARDGQEAVNAATKLRPDIILLDIGMPILNGIAAAKHIRQSSPNSRIIFMTQDNDPEIRDTALATDAEGYLVKANAASELVCAIAAAARNGQTSRTTEQDHS